MISFTRIFTFANSLKRKGPETIYKQKLGFAREVRAPLCVLWMLAVSLCGTSIEKVFVVDQTSHIVDQNSHLFDQTSQMCDQ